MSGPFDPLLQLDVEHAFFGGGACRGLSLQPTAATTALLQRAGGLMRATERGFIIHHDRSRRSALRGLVADASAPFVLLFIARSSDPWLASYTQGMLRDETTLLRFDSRRTPPPEADGRIRLHCGEFADVADRLRLTAPLLAHGLSRADRLIPPAFVLRLALRRGSVDAWADGADAPPPQRYLIRLQATATRWKYYLPSDWAAQHPHVVDLAGQAQFDAAQAETLGDGRQALTIRSQAAIAQHHQPPQRFQLRARGPLADRVLIKRLPVASAGQISAETIAGVRSLVSEIYVNR